MSFFAELKRRNVIRMAGLYLVAAWLLTQVSSTVLPMFDAPAWLPRSIVILLAIGFVPALVFAWVFELTPDGIKRDAEVKPEDSIAPQTARRMDRMLIAVLICALVYFCVDKFVLAPQRDATLVATTKQSTRAETTNAPATNAPSRSELDRKSVAVLPFVNMSGDPKNEYFSDGITEEILNALAQIPELKVAARTSAFAFKGKDPDLRKVGEILDVATVLEGSVQRSGDDVRITAQLIDTHSGYHLWSEKYDRKLTSIFAVEDEISKAIAEKLQLQLGSAHKFIAASPVNPQAHELYLRGLSLLAARGPGLHDAADMFAQAVKLDPQYAQAWGALAETQQLLPAYVSGALDEAIASSELSAQRALGIDVDTASALVAMANVHVYRLQWAQAEALFRRALVLAPADAEAVDQYAQFLHAVGQFEPALVQIDRARQLDPLSPIIGVVRASILMAMHRDAEASAQIESVLSAAPDLYPARMTAVLLYLSQERYANAEVQLRAVARNLGVNADDKAVLARGVADRGVRAAALSSLNAAPANADIRGDKLLYAAFLAMLGDPDQAIDQLQGYASQRGTAAGGILWVKSYDSLRSDLRYKAVLQRLGLPYKSATEPAP